MGLLNFKDWYENKEKSSKQVTSETSVYKISENIFKAPSKMLHIEIDVFSEKSKFSKNRIDRFYLNNDFELYSDRDLKIIEGIISEAHTRGNKMYIVGYDFSSSDPKKCLINSIRSAKGLARKMNVGEKIETRGLGFFEKISEHHLNIVPKSFNKKRIELIECVFDTSSIPRSMEMNFNFNPNDYHLLEKYKTGLKNILFQYILLNESFTMKIGASKHLPNSDKMINEENKNQMDLSMIQEMKYPDPNKSSLLFPENKPKISRDKITVKELTEKRAKSVVGYLSQISEGMKISFIPEGLGYKIGDPKIKISVE